ncbi:hypothetical protein C1X05_10095 [Laceyella sacchari]|nr:hypothetical protein C1X05_10095 [Laceyella sacchari]
MFRTNPSKEHQPELVNIEELVPRDHLLRKINETIDFSFIAEKCKELYCPVAQNIKKLAMLLSRAGKGGGFKFIWVDIHPLIVYIPQKPCDQQS